MNNIVIGFQWNHETNSFTEIFAGDYLSETKRRLEYWNTVAKYAKKTHKKNNADRRAKYYKNEIVRIVEYVDFIVKEGRHND